MRGFMLGVGVDFSPELICIRWLSGQTFQAQRRTALPLYQDTGFQLRLLISRFKVNISIPPKRATPPLGQVPAWKLPDFLSTPTIPALSAVDGRQMQRGLSICFPDKSV